ncbi:hypothetical protein ABZ372_04965 [Streptomyces sp. NPDC005921]
MSVVLPEFRAADQVGIASYVRFLDEPVADRNQGVSCLLGQLNDLG